MYDKITKINDSKTTTIKMAIKMCDQLYNISNYEVKVKMILEYRIIITIVDSDILVHRAIKIFPSTRRPQRAKNYCL